MQDAFLNIMDGRWAIGSFLGKERVAKVHHRLVKVHQKYPPVTKKHRLELDNIRKRGQNELDQVLIKFMKEEAKYLKDSYLGDGRN